MRSADAADAAVVLVADIDRGGAFAHLYGTWALLDEIERRRLLGFVLNKFRGDERLLPPGPQQLEELTGVPTLGVVPWLDHDLPDEDGAAPALRKASHDAQTVAVIRYPTASNLDEFKSLERVARLRWAWTRDDLQDVDLVVLPGSKFVASDLAWLRGRGFEGALRDRIGQGGRVLGICGGLQMLGERVEDPAGVDGSAAGLGLLPLTTRFEAEKMTRATVARFTSLPAPWSALSRLSYYGYEIRHGRSVSTGPMNEAIGGGLGYVNGPVIGSYVHGLFESPDVLRALFGAERPPSLEETFNQLADAIEEGLDMEALGRWVGAATSAVGGAP
jgi:adenosylcobyric acid synthase